MATGTKTVRNLIGGEWVDASGETFESRSPANGDLIGTFSAVVGGGRRSCRGGRAEAYASWRRRPSAPKRGEILFRFGALVAEHKEELSELMSREMGKVLAEAGGDVQKRST